MNYPDSVEYLYALGNETKAINLGLEPIRRLLEALGNPQDCFRSIHVAGTNGKGSTCALIEAALREGGIRTGLFTSPHLVEPTERIRIEGTQVTREQFADAFNRVHEAAERTFDGFHPSYFETVTAMAFVLFRELRVQAAVVEVGLGGRLDATNVITPIVSVITPVDFDHEKYLGNTLESIAGEKAGILKPGVPAVFARQRPEVDEVLVSRAKELGCPVTRAAAPDEVTLDATGARFRAGDRKFTIALPGAHQVENALTAVAALDVIGVEPRIESARWPGRLERVHEHPDVILDGAHNPAGARALRDYIQRFYSERLVTIVFGSMRDKSVQEITEILFPLAQRLILTAPDSPRATAPESLLHATPHENASLTLTVREALEQALQGENSVFITGSLYVVGEARALLVK